MTLRDYVISLGLKFFICEIGIDFKYRHGTMRYYLPTSVSGYHMKKKKNKIIFNPEDPIFSKTRD